MRMEALVALIAAILGMAGALFTTPGLLGAAVFIAVIVTLKRINDPHRSKSDGDGSVSPDTSGAEGSDEKTHSHLVS